MYFYSPCCVMCNPLFQFDRLYFYVIVFYHRHCKKSPFPHCPPHVQIKEVQWLKMIERAREYLMVEGGMIKRGEGRGVDTTFTPPTLLSPLASSPSPQLPLHSLHPPLVPLPVYPHPKFTERG